MAAVPLTFCEACRQYRAPWRDRIPAFCSACGRPVMQLDRVRIAADRDRIRYLLDEIHAWSRAGLIDGALCERLCDPYEAELALVARHLDAALPSGERPTPPGCHEGQPTPETFCPDCGADLAAWRLQQAAEAATAETVAPSVPAPALAPAAIALPQLVPSFET